MKLSGKVLLLSEESYTNKTTGQPVQMYRAYLESGDPLAGALEVSVTEEQYKSLKTDFVISFVPSFSTRTWNRNLIVTAKIFSSLEIETSD